MDDVVDSRDGCGEGQLCSSRTRSALATGPRDSAWQYLASDQVLSMPSMLVANHHGWTR